MKSFKDYIDEDFNVYPLAKAIYGRPMPSPGKNISFSGPLPAGFKGAGAPGIAPGSESGTLVNLPKFKKKKKIKKPLKD
jgi:hypothetical protein